MTKPTPQPERDSSRQPYRMRLPGFVSEEDIGLGDVITQTHIDAGNQALRGIAQRAATLNQWLVFGKG